MYQLQRSYSFLPLLNVFKHHTRLYSIHRHIPKMVTYQHRHKSTKPPPPSEKIDLDEPIKFSTSRAAKWKAQETYGGSNRDDGDRPWYQPYVVTVSLAAFLIYFCILRAENDMDIKLSKTLYDHIDGLEEKQLEISLQYSTDTGRDASAIMKRLEELKENKTDVSTSSPTVHTK